jgi:hypothetical protein
MKSLATGPGRVGTADKGVADEGVADEGVASMVMTAPGWS